MYVSVKNHTKIKLDELCQCPQKCDEKVPLDARSMLFTHFYGLGEADSQNQFLRQHMDLRARLNIIATPGSGRSPRRITCKYLVPILGDSSRVEVCQKAFVSAFVITTKRVRLQREKLISSLGLNSYSTNAKNKSIISDVNNTGISPLQNVALQLASCQVFQYDVPARSGNGRATADDEPAVKLSIDNPLIPLGLLLPEGVTIAPVTATPDHVRDIAIVNNFFSNQLWKPEYIGTQS